jgi:hypothetical protein
MGDDVSLSRPTNIGVYLDFWDAEFAAIAKEFKRPGPVGEETVRDRNTIARFCTHTGDILRYIRNRVRYSSFGDLQADDFGGS